jgi:hypothetical protein
MTKTTNFEISKKLAEIGFKAEAEKCWAKIRHSALEWNLVNLNFSVPENCDVWILSYDLETLLDVLPREIPHKDHKKLFGMMVHLTISFISRKDIVNIGYSFGCFDFIETKKVNESLADTAGRLIILLHEKNLIKF